MMDKTTNETSTKERNTSGVKVELVTTGGYFLRAGERKSAMMEGYTHIIEAQTNLEARRINAAIKKNMVYACETPLDAIDLYETAQKRGEDVHYRPPNLVFFSTDAVDHYDAMQDQKETIRVTREIVSGRSRKGYDIEIDPRKLEAFENAARWVHHSSIDDDEPRPHLHHFTPNIVNHEIPPTGAVVRIVHTIQPRKKGKSATAGRLANVVRETAHLPLAGTVFDPRRYRQIK